MTSRTCLALLSAVLLAACGDGTSPAPIVLSGTWRGPVQGPSIPPGVEVQFAMSELNEQITGAGSFFFPFDTLPISVYGSHRSPNFAVTLSSPGFYTIGFAGIVSGSTVIRGVLSGSGFTGESLTVRRQ